MTTTQINNKIYDIAEARWKMLPLAVQREHDILGMCVLFNYNSIYLITKCYI